METLLAIVGLLSLAMIPIFAVVWIIQALRKKETKKIKIGLLSSVVAFIAALILSSSSCEHEWTVLTCTEDSVCSLCGEIAEKAVGHNWVDATCESAKTCSNCGEMEGTALGHTWLEASCTTAKTCEVCNMTEGEALGHDVSKWKTTVKATCTAVGERSGECTLCGTVTDEIPMLEHKESKWEILEKATDESEGKRIKKCTVCGTELANETYELTDEEKEEYYKKSCKKYSYKEIARNPGEYEGKRAYFKGEVIQVQQQELAGLMVYVMRVNVTKGSYGIYRDTVYVNYYATEDDGRILEDDIITMYGELDGEKTYETIFGASVTIPEFTAKYIKIH